MQQRKRKQPTKRTRKRKSSARSQTESRVRTSDFIETPLVTTQGGTTLTRRHFLYGAAGVVVVAAVAGGGIALSQSSAANTSGDSDILSVASDDVITTDACHNLEDPSTVMTLVNTQTLSYGARVWAGDDNIAACLIPTDVAKPLSQVGLLSLSEGTCTIVIKAAHDADEGFDVYDVRANSQGMVWIEANILKRVWRVYHATLDNLNEPVLAAQGDEDWEMPTLAVVNDYAFWQLLPRTDGNAAYDDSKLFRARFGMTNDEVMYTSHGRMACPVCPTENGVVIAPRTDTSSVHYQLTCIDANTGRIIDTLVMPTSMKPLEIGYGASGFSFAFDAIYNYGDGISNLGTYTAATAVTPSASAEESGASYSSALWFRYPRTPTAAPAWCGRWFIVKSLSAVCGIDLSAREYFALSVEEGTDSYGDYLASAGTCNRIVTYSNIDYTTVDGENIKHCLVRTWEPVV